jgi:hypothetical protein
LIGEKLCSGFADAGRGTRNHDGFHETLPETKPPGKPGGLKF